MPFGPPFTAFPTSSDAAMATGKVMAVQRAAFRARAGVRRDHHRPYRHPLLSMKRHFRTEALPAERLDDTGPR